MQIDKENQGSNPSPLWWKNPTTITLLVAIIAIMPPITIGIQESIQASNLLTLENRKHLHTVRQEYLKHVLSEKQNRRVLEFLVAVEDDESLKSWAEKELDKTNTRIESSAALFKTKDSLYRETIQIVSNLAYSASTIQATSNEYKRFIELYKGDLISVESIEVEALMVALRNTFETGIRREEPPGDKAQELSFKLALRMKEELRADAAG